MADQTPSTQTYAALLASIKERIQSAQAVLVRVLLTSRYVADLMRKTTFETHTL